MKSDSYETGHDTGDYLNLGDAGFADLNTCKLCEKYGKIIQLTGNLLEAEGISAAIGDICRIVHSESPHPILAEVIGFEPAGSNCLP